jgi:hypothetical protein
MSPLEEEKFIYEHLETIFQLAGHDALVETVLRVAAELGIQKVDGISVGEFYERRKRKLAEELVCDYADVNVSMASKIKAIWDKMDRERESREK